MHDQAHQWVAKHAPPDAASVLDIGGRNINGTVRDLFPGAAYTAMDIRPGEGVDIIADAATWNPNTTSRFDVVVCTEVFEHTADWPAICATAFNALAWGGLFIATMAGPGRAPHSAVDGGFRLQPGEYYGNVNPDNLRVVLEDCGFVDITVDQQRRPADVRAVATKPRRARGGLLPERGGCSLIGEQGSEFIHVGGGTEVGV